MNNPFDPEQNVDAGVRHLKQLLENYGGDVKLTLAAYNAGVGSGSAKFRRAAPYAETQNYVRGGLLQPLLRRLRSGAGGNPANHEPVRVQRDLHEVLYISNTD